MSNVSVAALDAASSERDCSVPCSSFKLVITLHGGQRFICIVQRINVYMNTSVVPFPPVKYRACRRLYPHVCRPVLRICAHTPSPARLSRPCNRFSDFLGVWLGLHGAVVRSLSPHERVAMEGFRALPCLEGNALHFHQQGASKASSADATPG